MAKLTTEGFEDELEALGKLDEAIKGQATADILNAGADVMIDQWKVTIRARGHVSTRAGSHMVDAVDKTKVQFDKNGNPYIAIYPMGMDGHRVRQSSKAYILHYGRQANRNGKGAIKGDKFVDQAERDGENAVHDAMQKALDTYSRGET